MKSVSKIKDGRVLLDKALRRHREGDLDAALRLYDRILDETPDHADALHLSGVIRLQYSQPRDAIDHITRAITINPSEPAYYSNLAAALNALGLHDKALHYATQARAMGLATAENAVARATALAGLNQTEQASAEFGLAYRLSPTNPKALPGLTATLRSLGRLDALALLLRNHLARHGEADDVLIALANTVRDLGDATDSIALLDRCANKDGFDYIVARLKSLLQLQLFEDARPFGQRLLAIKDRLAAAGQSASFSARITERLQTPPKPFDPSAPHRNAICFSLWGSDPKYTVTAVLNAKLVPHVYPGWHARFYCDATVPAAIIGALSDYGAHVLPVAEDARTYLKLFWRFLASEDPMVDRFLCRDCDAVVNGREKAAVDAWLASDRHFHAMRDHIEHAELLMAGMWGGTGGSLPDITQEVITYYEAHSRRDRWVDQDFLRDRIWTPIKASLLVHDDIYAMGGETRPFPEGATLPPGQHVGGYLERDWVPVAEDAANSA
jgi:tetratricopeptide (TPR) repeat protein